MPPALLYDLVMVPLDALGLRRERRRLVAGLAGRGLELGAGTGLLFEHYGPFARPVAVDVDLDALRRARRRARGIPLVCADAGTLPFREASFDFAVEILVLCSVPDVRRTLAEMRRVLRPRGELRLLDHIRPRRPVLAWLADALTPLWARLSGGCHLNRQPARELPGAGFQLTAERPALGGAGHELRAK